MPRYAHLLLTLIFCVGAFCGVARAPAAPVAVTKAELVETLSPAAINGLARELFNGNEATCNS